MRLVCPCCGPRDSGEFSILGDATGVRPEGGEASLETMIDYVYSRDNPAGRHHELWYHEAGCRTWLVVTRDTRNHAISDVSLARDVARHRAERRPAS